MIEILSIIGLVLFVSFVCSILESTIYLTTNGYIEVLKEEKKELGEKLSKIKDNIDSSLSSILLINTFFNALGAIFVGIFVQKYFSTNENILYITFILVFLLLLIVEIIPKTFSTIYWKNFIVPSTYLICFFIKITKPLTYLPTIFTKKIRKERNEKSTSRKEIIHNILKSETEGIINDLESDIIENTLTAKEKKIKDILTPRSVLFALKEDEELKDILKKEQFNTFSRIPIYKESIEDIIGVVLSKDILKESLINPNQKVGKLIKKTYFLNENINVLKALNYMRSKKLHIIMVKDGYGQLKGVVSLEDCLETLLGIEIVDESDEKEDMRQYALEKRKNKKEK